MRWIKLCLPVTLLLTAMLAASLPAAADDATPGPAAPAAPAAPSWTALQPADWGFAISLDQNGALSKPGDTGWARPDLDFLWISSYDDKAGYPIYQVDGSTIGKDDKSAGTVLNDDEYDKFFDNMLAELTKDGSFKILQSSRGENLGGRTWQVFNVEEKQADKTIDYYSFFAHDKDGKLRLVNVYYNSPDDGTVFSLATSMLGEPKS